MFDKNEYIQNIVYANPESHFHFQQVSGSLLKTHSDSVFVRFDKTSNMEGTVFNAHPQMKVKVGEYFGGDPKYEYRDVTVLQILLGHDNSYVCEVVIHFKPGDIYYVEEGKKHEVENK